jgi:hypothetical protein
MTTHAADNPPDTDAALAGDAGRRLARYIGRGRLTLCVPESDPAGEQVILPAVAVEQIVLLLDALATETSDDTAIGRAGVALAAEVWPAEDFSDWEKGGE